MNGGLYLPKHLARRAYRSKVAFWYSKKLQHIILPASPIAPAPAGYERIECVHAHEVDKWSERLRQQEKRIREMTDEERYNFEEPIRAHMLIELRKDLLAATDQKNREFIAAHIRSIETKRELRRKEHVETMMACEKQEGVAP